MHFFHPIQQSAPHIYHSALPLSPRLSTVFPSAHWGKASVTGFYGRPNTWEAVVRTIRGDPERFTYATTFGHRIAAARDDNTVAIYDSITGILGLSLSPVHPVQAMGGSPDGSVLFCRHQGPSVTLWDIQTGGLIHTFTLKCEAEDIALSLKGRYLAYGLSDGSIKFSEIANKTEGTTIWSGSQVARLCWMEPEEQLAFAKGGFIHIWDVASGGVLRRFPTMHPVRGIVYSQKSNQLVITTNSEYKCAAKIINFSRGASSAWYWTEQKSVHFAFSQTTDELVCGAEGPTLKLFNIFTLRWRSFKHPAITGFVSPLPSGFVTVSGVGPDIRLMSLDERHSPPRAAEQEQPAPIIHTLDQGKIIAILRPGCSITLVESTSTCELLTIPFATERTDLIPVPSPTGHTCLAPISIPTGRADLTPICASLEHYRAVFRSEKGGKAYLGLWTLYESLPQWTVGVKESLLSIGGISPSGVRLVTFHDAGHRAHIHVRDARNGHLQVQLLVEPSHLTKPLEIVFESEDRFYFHYHTYHTAYSLDLQENTLKILCHGRQPLVERSSEGPHHVDDDMEWVVRGSKRVCWIPPGYINSAQPSYSWAGSTLIMYGQDGTLRMLTFRQ